MPDGDQIENDRTSLTPQPGPGATAGGDGGPYEAARRAREDAEREGDATVPQSLEDEASGS